MSYCDPDLAGFRQGNIRVLIDDWFGPRSETSIGSNVPNTSIALQGWIDDPEVGPLGDIEEGHADSLYSYKKCRINFSLNDDEQTWSFEMPSGVKSDFPSIRGVGEIYGKDDHALHENLNGVAIFYLSAPQNCWDVLMQCLHLAHAQNRLQAWNFTYLISETDLDPHEKENWGGWGVSKILGVRPRHFDATQTVTLGITAFEFANTVLKRN